MKFGRVSIPLESFVCSEPKQHFIMFIAAWSRYDRVHLKSALTHICLVDLIIESIPKFRGVWCTFSFVFNYKEKILEANAVDPDLTLCCVV